MQERLPRKKTGVPQNNKQKSTLPERPGVRKQNPNKRMVKIKTKIAVNRTPDPAIFKIPPVFLYDNACPEKVTDLQICQASVRMTGENNIIAAQRFGPIWHLYPKTIEDRALLAGGTLTMDGRSATLFSKNPAHLINEYNQPIPSAKLSITGLPLMLPSEIITEALVQEGFKPRSPILYDQIQITDAIPSTWYSGTRTVYIDIPSKTPLPLLTLASYDCQVDYIDYLGRGHVKDVQKPDQPRSATRELPKAQTGQTDAQASKDPQPRAEALSSNVDTSGKEVSQGKPNELEEGELPNTITSQTTSQSFSDKNGIDTTSDIIIKINNDLNAPPIDLEDGELPDTTPSVSNSVAPSIELEDGELPDTTPSVSNNVAPTIELEEGELPHTPPPQTAPLLNEIVIDDELLDASSLLNTEDLEEIITPSMSNSVALVSNPPDNSAGEAALASSTSESETHGPASNPRDPSPAPFGCTKGDTAHIDPNPDIGEQTTGAFISTQPCPPSGPDIGESANSKAPPVNNESNLSVTSTPSILSPALGVPSSGDTTPVTSESIITSLNASDTQSSPASGPDIEVTANIESSFTNSEPHSHVVTTPSNLVPALSVPCSSGETALNDVSSATRNLASNLTTALRVPSSSGETAFSNASSATSNPASNPALCVTSASGETALSNISSASTNQAPNIPDEPDVSKAEDLPPAVLEALFTSPLEESRPRGNHKNTSPNKKDQKSSIPRSNSLNSSLLTRSRGLLPDREPSRSRSTSRKRSKDSMTDATPEGPSQRSRLSDGN